MGVSPFSRLTGAIAGTTHQVPASKEGGTAGERGKNSEPDVRAGSGSLLNF